MPAERTRGVVAAAGGAVWRTAPDGGLETVLVHRERYDDWSLPKGKLDAGENALAAAVREVREETGLDVVAGRRSVRTRYAVAEGAKHVDYWLMQAVGSEEPFAANAEVDELRWLPVADAAELATHEHDRTVLADLARTDVPRAPTLLLVRHAKAGSRSDWDGPDDERPLDAQGRRQAQQLAAVLPVFGPVGLFAAERVRCRETLEPLAGATGLPLCALPELGEEEFAADPQAGLAVVERLLEPRDRPGVTVVCSQGGAIPSVLMALGVRWEGSRLYPPAAKGSVWALGGRTGALTADYYRDLGPDPDAP
ncbi:8-oxo-dGTP diphosphatase [Geodermatophilus bullaregiensis]|uniref:NUDIX hydrolase n=1 Tax=Geodermatophilus bullaregiensis TaxID=1564160 RepID=UPI00195E64E2|nr:NUDIX hydrolase [Geodermatophilus bullaregiensis]MBM7805527.1 8-oxo-dGTP diphosphatase [Geodermatophilus bullaregiensis]